ncbi:MAG: DHH family phosphoesterase [Nanoarchaeota archaeon]
MITAIKLKENKNTLDLRLGEYYTAFHKEGVLHLNKNIKVKTSQSLKDLTVYPVRVAKIIPPDTIMVDVISDTYKVKEDTEEKKGSDTELTGMIMKKAETKRKEFTWKHPVLAKMQAQFITVATIIRMAIYTKTPIIIRHHADCDGYASAINLERAILPLLAKEYGDYTYKYFSRNPSKTPFYDYTDALRDIEYALNNKRKYGNKLPLIILTDLGGGEENKITVSMARSLGAKIIIIDHHDPGPITNEKSTMCNISDAHLNPFLFGSDSRFPAGTLTYELAYFINEDFTGLPLAPAIAAVADRAERYEQDIFAHYTGLAKGYEVDYLIKLTRIIDYQALAAKFLDISSIMDILYGENEEKQRELVELLYPEIDRVSEEFKEAIKRYSEVKEFPTFRLVMIDSEACSFRGEYPSPGKLVGLTQDHFKEEGKGQVTIGKLPGMLIFRCDGVAGFDVNTIIAKTMKELPFALAEGGGHAAAGSMAFIQAARQDVLNLVMDYLSSLG